MIQVVVALIGSDKFHHDLAPIAASFASEPLADSGQRVTRAEEVAKLGEIQPGVMATLAAVSPEIIAIVDMREMVTGKFGVVHEPTLRARYCEYPVGNSSSLEAARILYEENQCSKGILGNAANIKFKRSDTRRAGSAWATNRVSIVRVSFHLKDPHRSAKMLVA